MSANTPASLETPGFCSFRGDDLLGFHLAKEDLHFRVHFKDPGQALSPPEPAN
ncbi:Hypothetical protein FKW44_005976 [Caligus rogercresseyi]|uniref:Uncharacterized protein n=1 Tax=Caligus rogercresseyi TaxID=217165 RepID=A0A7T8KCN2_CALRO|nr:Hypothetical protein FKW44_005976 [Caligus rogercresseyi]